MTPHKLCRNTPSPPHLSTHTSPLHTETTSTPLALRGEVIHRSLKMRDLWISPLTESLLTTVSTAQHVRRGRAASERPH